MSEAPSAAAAARRAAAQRAPAPEPPPSLGAHLVLLLNSLSLIGWTVVGATVGARLQGVRLPALLPLFPELELGDGASVWSAGVLGERSGWNTVAMLTLTLELLCCTEVPSTFPPPSLQPRLPTP